LLLEIKHTTTGTPSGSWAGIYRTTVNNVVPFNQWSYVTVTWDGTNNFSGIRFYVNGQEVSYNTGGGSSGIKVSDTTYNQYVGGGWDGLIDEFRLYNRVLSLSEITSDMNTPLGTPLSADVTPPTVSIASPVNGSTATGTIAVQISSSDDVGIQYVELYRDGILVGKDAVAPYQLMWSTTLVPNGTYNLAARAVDTSNNSATSSTISVTVDNAVAPRFNIVFVITDDQRWDTMQYMPLTTTLIGDAGVTFTNSFVGTPLCCPNRATFLTGQYSHNTGVLDNIINTGIRALDDTSTIATWLEQAGYRTSLIGKYFNRYGSIDLGPPYIPPGWSDWHSHSELGSSGLYYNYNLFENGTTVSYGSQPQDYSTDVLAAKAVQFIESTSQNQPLLLYFTPHAPHSSGGPPIPAPADIGSFSSLPPLRPVSYNEADVSDKPLWIRQLPLLTPTDDSAGDTFRIKQVESLQSVDRAVESIVDALQRTGRLDNTVIIFTSDNGMTWGEHRWLDDKWCLYEECIRAPLMIRVPGVAPRVEDNLVSSVDLAPSIAEWAGALPTNSVDGLSLNTLLNDPTSAWRDELFVEYIGPTYPFGASSRFRAVRTTDSIYGEYDNGDREFYDLMLDSYQLNNAVNNPSYSGEISNLDKTLEILKTQ
jgi:arylsulfatase A-like enzyme